VRTNLRLNAVKAKVAAPKRNVGGLDSTSARATAWQASLETKGCRAEAQRRRAGIELLPRFPATPLKSH